MNFQQFAMAHGLIITHLVSGKITRCTTDTKRSKKNGAYYFEESFGWVQNWQAHDRPQIWITDAEVDHKEIQLKIRKNQEKYNQERAKANQEAIKKAEYMLANCKQEVSTYLASKGFKEMCFNMYFEADKDPLLCVPMRINGKLSGLQVIAPDGKKKFIFGTNASMATFDIGQGRQVFLVEGLASGLSLQKILSSLKISYMIKVCFSAGNMIKMAAAMPNSGPVIICDNDESGTGQKVGIDSGCRYYIPALVGQDVNDECNNSGYLAVSQKIKKILYKVL